VIRKSAVPFVLMMLFALTVGSVVAADQSPLPIMIGYQSIPDWLLFVAKDLKLFEKAGLAPTR
jgi:ABC-type nitrate/sulfonate/bicarbonate transport system substrate-binding protein